MADASVAAVKGLERPRRTGLNRRWRRPLVGAVHDPTVDGKRVTEILHKPAAFVVEIDKELVPDARFYRPQRPFQNVRCSCRIGMTRDTDPPFGLKPPRQFLGLPQHDTGLRRRSVGGRLPRRLSDGVDGLGDWFKIKLARRVRRTAITQIESSQILR